MQNDVDQETYELTRRLSSILVSSNMIPWTDCGCQKWSPWTNFGCQKWSSLANSSPSRTKFGNQTWSRGPFLAAKSGPLDQKLDCHKWSCFPILTAEKVEYVQAMYNRKSRPAHPISESEYCYS